MSQLRVLIVGASIAGPAAAYWFAKTGARVTVIERFPNMRTNGQNVDIRLAGVTVMRKIPGMEAAVRAKVVPMEGFSFVNKDGHILGTIRPTGNPDQQSLISEYEIYRGDLAQILLDLTEDNKNVNYVFNEQVVSMQQSEKDDGPVTVEFMNDLPTSEYDLVVACDGATSRTRAIGLGCGVRDHIVPMNCWAAFFSMQQDLVEGSKLGYQYSSPGGRFLAVGPVSLGGNKGILMGLNTRDQHEAALPFRQAMKQGEDELKSYLYQHYKGAGWKTDEVIEAMMESKDFYANEIVQVKIPSPYKGRFALVGDAGYASGFTGTGTTLALVGAYVLAGEIGKYKGNVAAGLESYAKQMKPIIDEFQNSSRYIPTILAPQTAWGLQIRNNIIAFVAWTRIIEFVMSWFGGAFANTSEYNLPEYKWEA